MSIIEYTSSKTGKIQKNFEYREFLCHCGCGKAKHDTELSSKLQTLRTYVGKPVNITSPYRCPSHNAAVGGARASFHMEGKAADFIIYNMNVWEIGKICEAIGFNGIGVYDDGYVHVDVRPASEKYFWHNSDDNPVATFGGAELDIYADDVEEPSITASRLAEDIKKILKEYGYL